MTENPLQNIQTVMIGNILNLILFFYLMLNQVG